MKRVFLSVYVLLFIILFPHFAAANKASGNTENPTSVTVLLVDSEGDQLTTGSLSYFDGSWQTVSPNSDGAFTFSTTASVVTYRMNYRHSSEVRRYVPVTGDPVIFQTVNATVQLRNSADELFGEGTVEYYTGDWFDIFFSSFFGGSHHFGITEEGVVSKELLPGKYVFKMTYAHTSRHKIVDISREATITFETVKVTARLNGRNGELINGGQATYHPVDWFNYNPDEWYDFGSTSNGGTSKELFPKVYAVKMEKKEYRQQKIQHVGFDPEIVFNSELSGSEPPELTITHPADSITTMQDSILVSGSVDNPTSTIVTVNGQSVTVETDGTFSTQVALLEGDNTITISTENQSGKVTEATRNVIREIPEPKLAITTPADSVIFAQDSILVSGEVDNPENTTVTINGSSVSVAADNSFSSSVGLTEGGNTITILAENKFGKTAKIQRYVTKDTTPPQIMVSEPADSSFTNQQEMMVEGTVSGKVSLFTIEGDTTIVDQNGSFSKNLELAEGPNNIVMQAIDLAGNKSSEEVTVIGDFNAPDLSVSVALGAPSHSGTEILQANHNDTLNIDRSQIYIIGSVVNELTEVEFALNQLSVPSQRSDSIDKFEKEVELEEGVNSFEILAADQAGNVTTKQIFIKKPLTYPYLSIKEYYETNQSSFSISGTVIDTTESLSLTIDGQPITLSQNGEFSKEVSLVPGDNFFLLQAINANSNETVQSVRVVQDYDRTLPPNPQEVAPPVDSTVITTMQKSTEFLYRGENPIQRGVEDSTIEARRSSVISGKVLDQNGDPLPGVLVTILDHPEYGYTLSRNDGKFDMAANGGGDLVLKYEKDNYLSIQRQVDMPWQDYVATDEVIMVQPDPNVTTIDFSDSTEVARGSVESDADGSRQATLMFEQGTEATMVMPDGSTQPLTSINVRATEYTVGDNGPISMPAILPPTSAYTYCVELSVDEAEEAGAQKVQFDKPVAVYVENFLEFPVGSAVPTGYYDREQREWIASENGRVIEIISDSSSIAAIDINGDGMADPVDSLLTLGIDSNERKKIASLYSPGESLWRTEISHFSPIDHNWPPSPLADAEPPSVEQPEQNIDENEKSGCEEGSIISVENQTLGEAVNISGAPCGLHYNSSLTSGFKGKYTVPINLTDDEIPGSLKRVELEVRIAGTSFDTSFAPQSNLSYDFQWSGKDLYGRFVQGAKMSNAKIGYVYDVAFNTPASSSRAFGNSGQAPVIGNRQNNELIYWQNWSSTVGGIVRTDFGGWHPGIHHTYDINSGLLYKGNGTIRSVERPTETSDHIIRSAVDINDLNNTWLDGVAVGPDGSIYVSFDTDNSDKLIRKYPNGNIETVIEFQSCFTPTIAISTIPEEFECSTIGQIDVSSEGEVYFTDPSNSRVFKINTDGGLKHIAGTGNWGYSGDGGAATLAELDGPEDVAVAEDGSIYVADGWNNVIRKISTDGIITTIAGTGEYNQGWEDIGDGGPAIEAKFAWVKGLDIGPDGSIFIADADQGRIRKITPDGIINTVAGSSYAPGDYGEEFFDDRGDGGPATESILLQPYDVSVGADGSLYIAENSAHHIRKVNPEGNIFRLAGLYGENPYFYSSYPYNKNEDGGFNFNNGPAPGTRLSFPHAIAVSPNNNVYFIEQGDAPDISSRIRMIKTGSDLFDGGENYITSENGSQTYVFDFQFKHIRTEDALTGNTIFKFAYDSTGQLSKITDIDGLETIIERNSSDIPTAIIAPFGQRTELTMGPNGYLASVKNPEGENVQFSYTDEGLLTEMTDPKGSLTTYQYDSLGNFRKTDYPNGGFKELSKTETEDGFEITIATAEGSTRKYEVEQKVDGTPIYTNTDANGLETVKEYGSDGSVTVTSPDGTTTYTKQKPDPRFGMQAPLIDSMAVETPSGLVSTMSQSLTITQYTGDKVTGLTDSVVTNGNVTITEYDGNQRLTTTTSPEGRQSFSYTDSLGRVIQTSTPGLELVHNTYNSDGFLIKTEQGGRTTEFTYNSDGYLESTTDPLGRTETTEYDSAGRVTNQILPNGEAIDYTYDENGNLLSITPPGQPAHTFEYTEVDLTESYSPPTVPDSAGGIHYTYNLDKQLVSTVFSDSSSIEMVYDTTNGYSPRPTKIIHDQGTTSFDYDTTTGNLISVVSSDSVITNYSHDGSLTTQITTSGPVNGIIDFTYNNDFRVTSQSINGANTVGFSYDDDGLLVGAGVLSMSYSGQNGLLKADTLGNVTSSYSHNGFGELTQKRAAYNGSDLYNRSFTRDSLGRITSITETIGGQTDTYAYSYNDIGYLVQVNKNGSLKAEYQYDANGNRTVTVTSTDTVTATYDSQDRMLTYGDANYDYGPRGDLQQKVGGTDTTNYNYDNRGNLRSVTLPDSTFIEYTIDGQDRRVAKKVNGQIAKKWLYADGLMPIAVLDSTGSVEKRYGPGYVVKNDTTYRVVRDHLGSVRMVVNSQNGQIVQRIDYDAWGNITHLQNENEFTDIGFAGGLYDKHTGLIRFGARDYDPQIGSWTTKDPILFNGQQTNLYVYVNNNPVNFTDPNGKIAPILLAAAGGAVIGAAINGGAQVFQNYINGKDLTSGLGGALVGGAISGAIGGIAGPAAGTTARALGGRAAGLAVRGLSTGISTVGGALGQTAQNVIDPCSSGNIANAALFSGLGGFAGSLFPNQGFKTLSQGSYFGPKKVGTYVRSTVGAPAATTSSGIAAGAATGYPF